MCTINVTVVKGENFQIYHIIFEIQLAEKILELDLDPELWHLEFH